jgi:acyl-coenzyme A thioesterase PaaI-like protein
MLHGGIITGILDEVMWWTLFMETKKICATWKIEVEFKSPVVCGKAYHASGHLLPATHNADYLAAGTIEDESGKTCAAGNASFRIMRGVTLEDLMEQLDFRGVPPEMQSLFQSMKT